MALPQMWAPVVYLWSKSIQLTAIELKCEISFFKKIQKGNGSHYIHIDSKLYLK